MGITRVRLTYSFLVVDGKGQHGVGVGDGVGDAGVLSLVPVIRLDILKIPNQNYLVHFRPFLVEL